METEWGEQGELSLWGQNGGIWTDRSGKMGWSGAQSHLSFLLTLCPQVSLPHPCPRSLFFLGEEQRHWRLVERTKTAHVDGRSSEQWVPRIGDTWPECNPLKVSSQPRFASCRWFSHSGDRDGAWTCLPCTVCSYFEQHLFLKVHNSTLTAFHQDPTIHGGLSPPAFSSVICNDAVFRSWSWQNLPANTWHSLLQWVMWLGLNKRKLI